MDKVSNGPFLEVDFVFIFGFSVAHSLVCRENLRGY